MIINTSLEFQENSKVRDNTLNSLKEFLKEH